jgi:hypothetical protein
MSEQGRIHTIVEQKRLCDASVSLQKARQFYGCASATRTTQAQLPSKLLLTKVACIPSIINKTVEPESTRIQRRMQDIINNEQYAHEFNRFFPIPCPPVDSVVTNAFLPKASTACPLPNTLFNPSGPV